MKVTYTHNYINICPTPTKDKKGGLKIYVSGKKIPDYLLPVLTTDIYAGQSKYRKPKGYKILKVCSI